MAQETIKEMKKSVRGKVLITMLVLMVMLIINVVLGILLQSSVAQKTVESILTDNLNGSYALLQKGMSYFGGDEALSAENLTTIIANNACDTVIIDSSGKPIANYMKSGSVQSSYKDYVQKSGQTTLYPGSFGAAGERRCYAAKAIEGTDYTLLIGLPTAQYYSGLITAFWVSIALVVIMGGIAVFTILIFTKSVIKPLEKIRVKIVAMSRGELSGEKIDHDTDDELGVLASSVNFLSDYTLNIIGDIDYTAGEIAKENLCVKPKAEYNGDFLPVKNSLEEIVNSMKQVVADIEAAGHEVSSGSRRMSSNSQLLSQNADNGAMTVQKLRESLNAVHDQINDSTEKAAVAREMAEMTVGVINEGNDKMTKMLSAMREINETSSQIANIIKTIQDISFQTNILSLNASIEAARAGDAGKGFAVVAGEVGSLAGKTAEAAKSTTDLIETSLRAVEKGTVIANETAEMLGTIVNKAHESADVVEEIAKASTLQAESIQQSVEDMNMIADSVEQVSVAAHDCADSSTMLAEQSAMLEDTVNRFIIDESDTRAAASSASVSAPTAPSAPKAAPSVNKPKAAAPKPASNPAPKIELPDDRPKAAAAKPASKPTPKIELPGDKPKAAAPKPASKPTPKIELPGDKPKAAAAKPTPKIELPGDKPKTAAAKPAPKIELPGDKPQAAAFASTPAAKPSGYNGANTSTASVVQKASMQPVRRTVQMSSDKY